MKKLQIKDVLEFQKLKDAMDDASNNLEEFQSKLLKRYGTGEFEAKDPNGGFVRLNIEDIFQTIKEKGEAWGQKRIVQYRYSLRRELKNPRKKK